MLLAEQLTKLSPSETAVLAYLSRQSEPISLDRIFIDLHSLSDDTSIIKTLDKLVSRYLIDAKDGRFSLPESIAEYSKSQYSQLEDGNRQEVRVFDEANM
jgi:TBPIP/Hop2 winged helix domain